MSDDKALGTGAQGDIDNPEGPGWDATPESTVDATSPDVTLATPVAEPATPVAEPSPVPAED